MIRNKLFVRFALLGTLISAIMLVVSIFTTNWMRDLIFDEPFRDRGPFRAVERIIENMNPADRVQGLRDLQSRGPGPHAMHELDQMTGPHGGPPPGFDGHGPGFGGQMPPRGGFAGGPGGPSGAGGPGDFGGPGSDADRAPREMPTPGPFFDFVLLTDDGKVLFPNVALPEAKAHDLEILMKKLHENPKEFEAQSDIMFLRKLNGTPVQFLARGTRYRPPPPPPKHFALLMSIQLATILIAVLLTLGAVLFTIRQRAFEAEQVIRDLSTGNLKARIPISRLDEIGTVMLAFNKMADEIEHLIEHLRKTEHARRDLLRELAHDLRTPVASLKSLIETVNERADQLPKEKRRELLDLAMREADYFEGLVDDLLFLGRVQEPKYKTNPETFDLRELIRLEVEASSHRHEDVSIEMDAPTTVEFEGDPSLIKRLLRNAIENAVSFARSSVFVRLRDGQAVEITVSDDGPGFDAASLASFGQRKYSRSIVNGPVKRISIGLGSVIMKSITDAYRGELRASNRLDESSRDIQGADVSIRLPRA